jgi:hypothetical protein
MELFFINKVLEFIHIIIMFWINSLILRVIFLKIGVFKSNHSDCSFLCTRDISSSVLEKLYRVNWPKVTSYSSNLCPMHYIANVSLKSGLTTSHSCQNSLHTSTHYHVILWVGNTTEKWTNWNRIHWQLLLKVSDNLKCFWINDFGSIISSSPKYCEVFAKG